MARGRRQAAGSNAGQRQFFAAATAALLTAVALLAGAATTPLASHAGPPPTRIAAPQGGADPLVAPVLVDGENAPTTPQGAVTVSPEPGSQTADPKTEISFLGRPAAALGTIQVTGSESGPHTGSLEAYSTGTGASFVPSAPFIPGETVTVATDLPIVGATNGTFSFTVAVTVPLTGPIVHPVVHNGAPGVEHYVSTPKLAPPAVTVTDDALRTNGDFFLSPKGAAGQAGPMIVTPSGTLVWFEPLHGDTEAFDLNVQRYEGEPVLTWFQGEVIDGHGQGVDMIVDEHYRTVAVVRVGNGLQADLHEFKLTPDDTALVSSYRTMRWDTTSDGGTTNGTVLDSVVQEIDIATGLVMMEWDSLDHVPVTASNFVAPKAPAAVFDYFHIDAIQPLAGGDLLVSSRNTSAAYEVDPAADGDVLFTLGGTKPTATMGRGTAFWYEHDVELRPGGEFTIFDDGSAPQREPLSRALTEKLDTANGTVTLVRSYTTPGVLAGALGNVELISGGGEVVGWGTAPRYSVLGPSGDLIYEATLPPGVDSYRADLRAWTGRPTTPPTAVVLSGGRVAMSWNGETGIASWRVLSGPRPDALTPRAPVPSAGYQTVASFAPTDAYVAVQALDSAGHVLGTSPAQPS